MLVRTVLEKDDEHLTSPTLFHFEHYISAIFLVTLREKFLYNLISVRDGPENRTETWQI